MTRSLKIDFGKDGFKGTVDLCEEMRRADGNMVGLAKMCSDFLGKEMCKYNTRSNWGQSELRQSQVHYAALDAYAVLVVWEKLTEMRENGDERKFYQKHNLLTTKGYAKLTQERKDNREERLRLKELEFQENFKVDVTTEKLESAPDSKEPETVNNTQLQVP
jgi:ribonuclease D